MPAKEVSKCDRFMRCFSALDNISKLSKPRSKKGDSELEVLNGVRFLSCVFIILGNVFLFTLKSPLQNLEVLQSWFSSGTFSLALGSDLVVDSFFWLSAFLGSYQLLNRMRLNDGKLPSKFMLIFTRWWRIWPLYFFALLVFWRFIPLLGTGPLFFAYAQNDCDANWIWHLTFLNNIIPWKTRDGCMNWSWYLACEMQFFLLLPHLVETYSKNRPKFWFWIVFWWSVSNIFSIGVIANNDLEASFFAYKDEYWTLFYEKPYARLPCYLVGVVWGCSYFSYKYED